jgi:hypothetical protein
MTGGVGDRPSSPDLDDVGAAKRARVEAETTFGERLRALCAKAGARPTNVARLLGMRREDLYEVFDGFKHARAAWLELLPPAVEQLYLAARAAHHGLELRPIASEDAHPRALHDVVMTLSLASATAAEGESDGELSVAEIDAELARWERVDEVRSSRVPYLRRMREQRGGVVEMAPRRTKR